MRPRKPGGSTPGRAVVTVTDMQLNLICEEEELSPAQIKDFDQKMKVHRESKALMRSLRDQKADVHIPAGAAIPAPPPQRAQPMTNGGKNKV